MRKFFRSLTNVSLYQQLGIIIVTFAFIFIFFFTVYLKGNVDDFVNRQVMNLLQKSQATIITNLQSGNSAISELSFDADVVHFVFHRDNMKEYYGTMIYSEQFLGDVTEIIQQHQEGAVEAKFASGNEKYFYRLETVNKYYEVISIVAEGYGKSLEDSLMNDITDTIAIVVFILFILLMVWVTTIIGPLQQIRTYIKRLRNGEEATLVLERNDEIGEMASELVSMQEEIKHQEETKMEMVHNISHDLKTPIATIKSYAESIKDGIYPYGTMDKSIDVIIENADRLEKKVYSLLFLNRIDYIMDQEKDTDQTTDMKVLIDEVIKSFRMIRPEVRIVRQIEEARFRGEEESWRVVIENLLDNALRYAQSEIVIRLEPYRLSVSNDGPTLTKERMQKLFKPFEKGSKGKFGLGLSICYKVCNAYDYNISAENLENGVIFIIEAKTIPKKEKEKEPIMRKIGLDKLKSNNTEGA